MSQNLILALAARVKLRGKINPCRILTNPPNTFPEQLLIGAAPVQFVLCHLGLAATVTILTL